MLLNRADIFLCECRGSVGALHQRPPWPADVISIHSSTSRRHCSETLEANAKQRGGALIRLLETAGTAVW